MAVHILSRCIRRRVQHRWDWYTVESYSCEQYWSSRFDHDCSPLWPSWTAEGIEERTKLALRHASTLGPTLNMTVSLTSMCHGSPSFPPQWCGYQVAVVVVCPTETTLVSCCNRCSTSLLPLTTHSACLLQ